MIGLRGNTAAAIVALAVVATLSPTRGDVVHAQIRGEIVGAGATLLPVAVPDLKRLGNTAGAAAAKTFVKALRRDLELSGIFRVIDPVAYIDDAQTSGTTRETINFENWRSIGAMVLIRGTYIGTGTDISVEVRSFDVADHSSSGGRRLNGSAHSPRACD